MIKKTFLFKKIALYVLCVVLSVFVLVAIATSFHGVQMKNEPFTKPVTALLVLKSERKLIVYSGDEVLRTYRVALGKEPVGPKEFEGDMKTPEGRYKINDKNAKSSYYKNLGISYPNPADRQQAAKTGRSPGGQIKIHGLPNNMPDLGKLHYLVDWTHGCIAVNNQEMEELFQHVPIGTPIEIKP